MSATPLPHDLSPPITALLGFCFEGPLYGLNVALYICCVRSMLKASPNMRKRLLLALATLQLALATAHVIVFVIFLKKGFIDHGNVPQGEASYFADTSTALYAAQLFFYMTNNFIADAIMAWRCYIVWGHNNYIGAFYTMTVLGTSLAGYSAIAHIRLQSTAAIVDIFAAARWMTSMFALSIVTQVTATSLIAVKLGWSRAPLSKKEHLRIIWMIVESGAILTASTLTIFVLYLLDFNAGQLVSEIAAQLGCMVPTSIIVRTGMSRTQNRSPKRVRGINNIVSLERGENPMAGSQETGSQYNMNTFSVIDSHSDDNTKSFAVDTATSFGASV